MNRILTHWLIAASAVALMAGCENKDDEPVVAVSNQGELLTVQDIADDFVSSSTQYPATWSDPSLDMKRVEVKKVPLDQPMIDRLDGDWSCDNNTADTRVICGDQPFVGNDVYVVTVYTHGALVLDDVGVQRNYSLVLDSDDDPANNWQYVDPWDLDTFQGTDRWFSANCIDGYCTLFSDQVDDTMTPVMEPTGAFVVLTRENENGEGQVDFVFPTLEIPAERPRARVTFYGGSPTYDVSSIGNDHSGDDLADMIVFP